MRRQTHADGGSDGGNVDSIDRRTVLATGGTVIAGGMLAGCLGGDGGNGNGNDSGNGNGNGNGGGGADEMAIISSPAGFDDNAFNDNALDGLEQAADEFDFAVNTIEETEEAQYESVQADAADQGYDLIVCVSDNHTDALTTNAEDYPDQNWMLINNVVDTGNVSGWIEMNNEMSFLAGVVAGVMTGEEFETDAAATDPESATVGFVGGEENDLIQAFEQSYVEGAEWVNEDVEVLTGYGGSFNDPSGVEDVASSQIDDGADIVWHAASAAGAGAFSAAQNNGRFGIGVDVDQSVTEEQYADIIIGSAVKALDEATYQVAQSVVEGTFDEMVGEQNLSLENEGIDFVIGQEFEDELPDRVQEEIDNAKQGFADGEIELSCGPTSC
ncbi:BMP family lipoprotein [Saliphagus infecundisoli]|uniref:BMP family protein n=1 Tax=Saliphagus infecundisoli TaxID=1849069 RepID=A0ABD5QIW7_9EURY|nr:BMP family ABC transporter substrate-binding protein [Saliphagus infecundisoli]